MVGIFCKNNEFSHNVDNRRLNFLAFKKKSSVLPQPLGPTIDMNTLSCVRLNLFIVWDWVKCNQLNSIRAQSNLISLHSFLIVEGA